MGGGDLEIPRPGSGARLASALAAACEAPASQAPVRSLDVGPVPSLARSVLIVDDEFLVAQGTQMQVEDMGVAVCATAGSADEAVTLARRHRPALVLMDLRLPGEGDGVDAAVAIHRNVGSKIIFITGSRDPEGLERIARLHPAPVLFKPVAGSQLERAVRSALGSAGALGQASKGAAGV